MLRGCLRCATLIALAAAPATARPAPAGSPDAAPGPAGLEALFAMSVEELLTVPVAAASKHEEPLWRSPNAVTVISAETLRAYGHRTLAEALATVVGTIPGFDGWRESMGMRGVFGEGTFDSRMLWLVDGHSVNDGYFQGISPGITFPVDLNDVDHVEVIRGPASSVYGSNAFFGVINVVTRSAGAGGSSLVVGAEGFLASPDPHVDASDLPFANRRTMAASLSETIGDVKVRLAASHVRDDGRPIWIPYFTATGAGGLAERKDQVDADKLLLDLRVGRLRLLAAWSDARLVTPDASYGSTPDSPLNAGRVGYRFAELQHEAPLGERLTLTSRAFVDHSTFVRDWHYLGYWPVDRQEAPSARAGIEERIRWVAGPNALQAGVELQRIWTYQRENYPSEPFESDARYSMTNLAVWANDELSLGDRAFAVAGLRVERNQRLGTFLSGRGALGWRPVDGTTLKLQAGQGFKDPLLHDYYYHSSTLDLFQWQIAKLGRERVGSVEAVWSQVLAPVRVELVAFYNRIRDLVTYDNVTDSYRQTGGVDSVGAELEVAVQVAATVSGYANGSWHRTRSTSGGKLYNAPAWSAKAGAVARLLRGERLSLAVETQVYGPADFEDDPSRPGLDLRQGSYALVNVNLSGRLADDRLGWNLGVRNLLDARYAYPVAKGTSSPFPGAGTAYRFGLDYRF
jgi:outer membrane receptor protein involved in Fe transport